MWGQRGGAGLGWGGWLGAAYPLALVGVLVGVVAQCQASVCPLDLIQAGARPHAQQVVVARLLHHRPHRCEGEASPPCPASPTPPLLRASVSPLRVPPVDKPQCCAGGWGGLSLLIRAAPGWGCPRGCVYMGGGGVSRLSGTAGRSPWLLREVTAPVQRCPPRGCHSAAPRRTGGWGGGGEHTPRVPAGIRRRGTPSGRWGWATRGRGGR